MIRPLTSLRTLVLIAALPLLGACDTYFGERPIGGGKWSGVQTRIEAGADVAWPVVAAELEALGAGKLTPYPADAETAVRATYEQRWVKVAVDAARPYASIISVYAVDDLELAQDLARDLIEALRGEGMDVDEPEYRTAHDVEHQAETTERAYADGYWGGSHAGHDHHDEDHHGDEHGDDHGDGHDDHGGDDH